MIPKDNRKDMKVLFVHNSVPEYRIKFWKILKKKCDLDLLITGRDLDKKIYNLERDVSGLNIYYYNSYHDQEWIGRIKEYDILVLPPCDNFILFLIANRFANEALNNNVKVVFWTEGWPWKRLPFIKATYKYILSRLKKILCRKSDVLIASGSQVFRYLSYIGVDKSKLITVIDSSSSPIPSISNIRKKHDLPQNAQIVLFLGRLVRRKGCDILIKAFNDISSIFPNAYLLIAGEGEDKKRCEQLASKMSAQKKIRFVGKIQPQERAAYFKESNLFVLPSYAYLGTSEAWGLTVNEALEQGTPVVATTVVGAAYDLLDGNCGDMVEENNIESLANGIRKYLRIDKNEIENVCIEKYSMYSVENMANGFYNAFKNITR